MIDPASKITPLQSLMRFYEAERRYSMSGKLSDRQLLLETLHPEIVLYQPESLPYGGEWRGRDSFGDWLDAFVKTWSDVSPTDPMVYSLGHDTIVCRVTMNARARVTGAEIVMPMCQLIRCSLGMPVEWRNFAWDTAKMLAVLVDKRTD